MAHKLEIYKDAAEEYRVRFSYNGEVIFASEGYTSKQSAIDAIECLKEHSLTALLEDNS